MKTKCALATSVAILIGFTGCSTANVKAQMAKLENSMKSSLTGNSNNDNDKSNKSFNVKEFNSKYNELIMQVNKSCKDIGGSFQKRNSGNTRYRAKDYQQKYGMTRSEIGSISLVSGTCYKDGKVSEFKSDNIRLESNLDIVKKSIDELKAYKDKKNQEKVQRENRYIEEYKNGKAKFKTQKELCESDFLQNELPSPYNTSFGDNLISWDEDRERCTFLYSMDWDKSGFKDAKEKYETLKDYVLEDGKKIIAKEKKLASMNFEAIKKSGRVYLGIAMDSTRKQNGIEKSTSFVFDRTDPHFRGYKYAGLPVKIYENKNEIINLIVLQGEVKKDNLNKIVSALNKKYKKVSSDRKMESMSLEEVKRKLYNYHNSLARPSQADYERDIRNAKPIKTTEDTVVYKNKGDKITLIKKISAEGNNEKYYISISYLSKVIAEKREAEKNAKLEKVKAESKKASNQLNNF